MLDEAIIYIIHGAHECPTERILHDAIGSHITKVRASVQNMDLFLAASKNDPPQKASVGQCAYGALLKKKNSEFLYASWRNKASKTGHR